MSSANTMSEEDSTDTLYNHVRDALLSSEGAANFEGIYGQPIDRFPRKKWGSKGTWVPMTLPEFAHNVEVKLWEFGPEGMEAARAKHEEARQKKEEEERKHETDFQDAQQKKERAKQERAKEREKHEAEKARAKKAATVRWAKLWAEAWDTYTTKWEQVETGRVRISVSTIPWPVWGGSYKDLNATTVGQFFRKAPREKVWRGFNPENEQLRELLKQERARWHPDKINQKYGGQDIDRDVIEAVTEVSKLLNVAISGRDAPR
ncbi:hypothetical protein B0O99DRAFT_637090 [Bisporella sp. PMI_857]|nr:hypothetical protein B0O99DRAFT_637090 [Bisporella sp. PMI_857]